jgi:co-chaperonin GroES (HSP10)
MATTINKFEVGDFKGVADYAETVLPPDMPQCSCREFRDAGYKIESAQFPGIKQCSICGGFKRFALPSTHSKRGVVNGSGLHPLKHAVLVRPYEVEKTSKGGIVLLDQSVESRELAEQRAVIIELGEDAEVGTAKVGDKVLFSKWSGQIAMGTLDEKKYRVVNDRDIFLVIEDSEDV